VGQARNRLPHIIIRKDFFNFIYGDAMTAYLIRRVLQSILVVFISAVASYVLLSLAPGGPLAGLRQVQQNSRFKITEEDIARIRASRGIASCLRLAG
jgi:hypothetical protein